MGTATGIYPAKFNYQFPYFSQILAVELNIEIFDLTNHLMQYCRGELILSTCRDVGM